MYKIILNNIIGVNDINIKFIGFVYIINMYINK